MSSRHPIARPGPTPAAAQGAPSEAEEFECGGGAFVSEIGSQLDDLKASTIMIVDDEPTTIDVLEAFLQGEGYSNFLLTEDPREALDRMSAEGPDVVLLDLHMPHVGGFEILEAMRKQASLQYIPVIILTSDTGAKTKLRALELGATDFLSKPVDPSELALRLRNTLAAKAYQDRLVYIDGVTGLPNRRSFTERTNRALRRARHEGMRSALLHIDLQNFERINDTLGHRVGDELLQQVSRRIEDGIRSSDIVGSAPSQRRQLSRVGGTEFALFLCTMASAEDSASVARRIISKIGEPFHLEGRDFFVGCNVGIALAPDDGEDIETLLRYARMSNAKQTGRDTYSFYSRSLNVESLERLSIENQLRRALERDEMVLHYQPQLDIPTGRIIGTEALMRWQHPELGLVAPGRFIPIAEETGLIGSLGEWALREACRQNKAWHDAGLPAVRVSVNVSTQQFLHGDLLTTIRSALEESGLEARHLVVELTESMIMENPREASDVLRQLKDMDLRISVDDFGTGYSALSYLKRFPLTELKIDRSFVNGIPEDADGAAIVSAIIAMAHSLGLRVVAEGVETEEQLRFLRERGCDEYQGFLFSRPVAPAESARLLADRHAGDRGEPGP